MLPMCSGRSMYRVPCSSACLRNTGPRSAEIVVTIATARITAQTITVRRTNVRTVRVTGWERSCVYVT